MIYVVQFNSLYSKYIYLSSLYTIHGSIFIGLWSNPYIQGTFWSRIQEIAVLFDKTTCQTIINTFSLIALQSIFHCQIMLVKFKFRFILNSKLFFFNCDLNRWVNLHFASFKYYRCTIISKILALILPKDT